MGNGKYPQLWAQGKCKNVLNYMLRQKWQIFSPTGVGKRKISLTMAYGKWKIFSIMGVGEMGNILNYGCRENVKISSSICFGKMENILN
jgi:hypothetical protein